MAATHFDTVANLFAARRRSRRQARAATNRDWAAAQGTTPVPADGAAGRADVGCGAVAR